jgi:hypothetical protein
MVTDSSNPIEIGGYGAFGRMMKGGERGYLVGWYEEVGGTPDRKQVLISSLWGLEGFH